jgi:roadblock/LC7 domain-containing protein
MADSPEASITGVTQTVANLSKFGQRLVDEIVLACEAVQQNVINNARNRVPVVTGNLQGSIVAGGIEITDDNVSAAVGANANYAGFVEGVDENWEPLKNWTRKITPYLGPALLENQGVFVKAISAAVRRAADSL